MVSCVINGLHWAKRTPYLFQKNPNTLITEGLACRLKITTGLFDFRRTKERSIRFVVRCFSNDILLSTGISRSCKVLPKKRIADGESDDNNNVLIPICWLLDSPEHNENHESTVYIQHGHIQSSPDDYHDEDSVMANINDSEERFQSYSNEADSDELSLIPVSKEIYEVIESGPVNDNDHSDNYMILYNGNAEVIGNFRALNFYKASDINIKEDVRLLIDDYDPRSVLLKIDGVEYKFKQGATNAPMNKRFVGYIAQQIESVVPEAVQLIDGVLHVDYESLIPYLCESIKQNFRDISDMKADASQIHKIVDMMYAEFIKKEQKANKSTSSNLQPRSHSLRWIIGTSLAVLLLISVAIGVLFIVPFMRVNNNQPNPEAPSPSSTPSPALLSLDQDTLVEFYHATGGDNWKNGASPLISACKWPGVSCNEGLRVVSLVMDQNNLVGTIPDSIGSLSKLRTLIIASNYLNGTMPASIGNLTSLGKLCFRNTQFNGSVPLEIFSLPSLTSITIGSNYNMLWTIPPQIGNMKQLEEFNVYQSGLHGTIPNEISLLTNLTLLALQYGQLNGTVPNLERTSITKLSLNDNRLSGPVPKLNGNVILSRGQDPQSTGVVLMSNYFSGEFDLPSEFWRHIDMIDISDNKFTSVSPRYNSTNMNTSACLAVGNPFKCPIPDWFKTNCKATCT